MEKIKVFRKIIKPFLKRGIGDKFPFRRNLFYRQLSKLAVSFLSPIVIPGNNKLYLPRNGIDYLILPYEEFAIKLMRKFLNPGDTFLDIGAGIGYHTVICSKIVGENGMVIAFEPDPDYFKFLQDNVSQNRCLNVLAYQKAVSNKTGKTRLYRYEKIGRNRLEEVNGYLAGFKMRDTVEIDIVKLDEFYFLSDKKINLIKMDIEGSEYLALSGMTSLIKRNPEIKIIVEMPDYKNLEFIRLLKKLKFEIYEINTDTKTLDYIKNTDKFMELINARKTGTYNLFCKS